MNAIIVGSNGRPSILEMIKIFNFDQNVAVFTYLRLKNGKIIWRRYDSATKGDQITNVKEPSFNSGDKVIMWGTRIVLDFGEAIIYNPPKIANNASNKRLARFILEREGVATPKLVTREKLHEVPYPLIIRRERHRAGIDFNVVENDSDALRVISKMDKDKYYMSEVYPKTAEYRAHCAKGKILLIKEKPAPEDKSIVAWNFHQLEAPWKIVDRKDYDFEMAKLALDAMKAIGLDYGAVDIMSYPSKEGYPNHVVAEINTAPSYTPYLIEKYGKFFNKVFRTKGKMEEWDYSKFKKGPSLSWKNEQLNN